RESTARQSRVTERPTLLLRLVACAAHRVGERAEPFNRSNIVVFGVIPRAGPGGTLRNERDTDPFLLEIDGQNLERSRHPRGDQGGPSLRTLRRTEGRRVCQSLDTWLQFDEGAELRDARDAASAHLADRVRRLNVRPRIGRELLQPKGDLLFVLVNVQNLGRDLVAGLGDLRGVRHAGPPHLGHVQQALHTATEVDERAELTHRRDASGQDRAGDDRLPDVGSTCALLLLEKSTPRDDEIPAAVLVLDDTELVDAPFVRRRVRPDGVDLRDRAEGAAPCDAHLIPTLHRSFDLAFHWETGVKCVFELPLRRGPSRQFPRERQPRHGRHDNGLNAVADGYLEIAPAVFQFADGDRRLP